MKDSQKHEWMFASTLSKTTVVPSRIASFWWFALDGTTYAYLDARLGFTNVAASLIVEEIGELWLGGRQRSPFGCKQ